MSRGRKCCENHLESRSSPTIECVRAPSGPVSPRHGAAAMTPCGTFDETGILRNFPGVLSVRTSGCTDARTPYSCPKISAQPRASARRSAAPQLLAALRAACDWRAARRKNRCFKSKNAVRECDHTPRDADPARRRTVVVDEKVLDAGQSWIIIPATHRTVLMKETRSAAWSRRWWRGRRGLRR